MSFLLPAAVLFGLTDGVRQKVAAVDLDQSGTSTQNELSQGSGIVINEDDIKKQGFLDMQSRHMADWRLRYIVVTQHNFYSFEKEDDLRYPTENVKLGKDCTLRSTVNPTRSMGKDHAFQLNTPQVRFYLNANTNEDKESWIGVIGQQINPPTAASIKDAAETETAIIGDANADDEVEDAVADEVDANVDNAEPRGKDSRFKDDDEDSDEEEVEDDDEQK